MSYQHIPWVLPLRRPRFIFYSLRFRLPTRIPPYTVPTFIYISIFYIFSGGVYNRLEDPPSRGVTASGEPLLNYPDLDKQFLLEGYIAGVAIMMGAMGLYLFIEAVKDPHDAQRAFNYQLIGIVLVVIAFIIIQNMWYDKCLAANVCKRTYPQEYPQ